MAERNIVALGFEFPIAEIEQLDLTSNRSLIDADIIVVEPLILSAFYSDGLEETHAGLPLLNGDELAQYERGIAHWKEELSNALQEGKTIFFFLTKVEQFYLGNRRTVYGRASNYDLLPVEIGTIVAKSGTEIRTTPHSELISSYWRFFQKYSLYQVYFEGKFDYPLLTTRSSDKIVGAVIKAGRGSLVLLPEIIYSYDKLLIGPDVDKSDDEIGYTEEGRIFARNFLSHITEIDKALRVGRRQSPPPDWVSEGEFTTEAEQRIRQEIAEIDGKIRALEESRAEAMSRLEQELGLRRLLYATGAELEEAILATLRLLGFTAEQYQDGDLEFDAVFHSTEGRFLGEAEGKDNKPINIDKLSQLERNIQDDFQREDVADYAKGVLFGNAFRLEIPESRGDYFTDKCRKGAARLNVALVRTPDLFPIAAYLTETNDQDFAHLCRGAIFRTGGDVVVFPTVPDRRNEAESNTTPLETS